VHIGMRVKVNFSASTSGQNVPFFVPAWKLDFPRNCRQTQASIWVT
jgi:hypothetical protein